MSDSDNTSLTSVANRLVAACQQLSFHPRGPKNCKVELPSRTSCVEIMHQLRSVLFPGYFQLSEFSEEGMSVSCRRNPGPRIHQSAGTDPARLLFRLHRATAARSSACEKAETITRDFSRQASGCDGLISGRTSRPPTKAIRQPRVRARRYSAIRGFSPSPITESPMSCTRSACR